MLLCYSQFWSMDIHRCVIHQLVLVYNQIPKHWCVCYGHNVLGSNYKPKQVTLGLFKVVEITRQALMYMAWEIK